MEICITNQYLIIGPQVEYIRVIKLIALSYLHVSTIRLEFVMSERSIRRIYNLVGYSLIKLKNIPPCYLVFFQAWTEWNLEKTEI
jgi:hypothetical protein